MLLPACVAWMVQVPTATGVTVAPDAVQTLVVCELKLSGKPEEAVALGVNGTLMNSSVEIAPKVMVCDPCCVTVICWPSTVMCATRGRDGFAVKEKGTLMAPFGMAPMVSQL